MRLQTYDHFYGRGDRPSFELVQDGLAPFFDVFTGPPEPFVLAGARLEAKAKEVAVLKLKNELERRRTRKISSQ